MFYDWKPYVPVAERRKQAEREMARRRKQGLPVSPVVIDGRTIARTFWGKAWCDNLEHYSDFANRLPRGRTYVRNGSVVDLQLTAGRAAAVVSGSELYEVAISVTAVATKQWGRLRADCAGGVDSLVELLQGRLSDAVMQRICAPQTGLFPAPRELRFSCSCPDVASMCKHVAAVLYGVGARLDAQPELLFTLRGVDAADLVAVAAAGAPLARNAPARGKVLADDGLAELFGIELAKAPARRPAAAKAPAKKKTPARKRRSPLK